MGLLRVSCCYYPKPNITLSLSGGVSLGGAVSVWCRGQHRGVRFVLNEERHHFPPVDSDRFEAVFPISNVRREDGGNYSCSYHSRSEPFTVSYPSEPVELVVRGEEPGSASPFPAPPPGQRRDVRFFLHKAGDLNPQRQMDPAGDGAEFRIPTVGWQHRGSYSCSYRPRPEPFVSSEPSDTVQLVIAGEGPGSTSPLPAGPSKVRHPDGIAGGLCQGTLPRLPLHWGHSKESGPRGCPSGHSPVLPPQPASPPTAPPLSAPSLGPRPYSTHLSAPFHPPIAAPQPIFYFLPPLRPPDRRSSVPPPWPRGAVGSESPPTLRPQQVPRVPLSWGCRGGPGAKASPVPTMVLL
uniref:Immunoglobulin-like beta-sandwich domain-containing protein n=1 Tax=Terrapene triunguis TaxID=2587831 RepID=A0A674J2Q8_9SAUR